MIETRRRDKKKTVKGGAGGGITPYFSTLILKAESSGMVDKGHRVSGLPTHPPSLRPQGAEGRDADSWSFPPLHSNGLSSTRAKWGRGPGTCRATLTFPICSSTSSRGSTVRPLLLLATGQPKLTGTPGEDADEASEDEGEEGGGGGGEEIRTSSGSAIEQGWHCGIGP